MTSPEGDGPGRGALVDDAGGKGGDGPAGGGRGSDLEDADGEDAVLLEEAEAESVEERVGRGPEVALGVAEEAEALPAEAEEGVVGLVGLKLDGDGCGEEEGA